MTEYTRLTELQIPHTARHVLPADLKAGLERAGLDQRAFHELFGCQTCAEVDGKPAPYAWDVEAVLEKMMSGKNTGSQEFWD